MNKHTMIVTRREMRDFIQNAVSLLADPEWGSVGITVTLDERVNGTPVMALNIDSHSLGSAYFDERERTTVTFPSGG